MERQEYLQHLGACIHDGQVINFTDHAAEITTITNGTALVDLGNRDQFFVEGPDAIAYLNRLLTFDVASMKPGEGARPFLLDARGRIILTFNLYCLDTGRFHIDATQGHGAEIAMRLDMFHFGEKISWGPSEDQMLSSIQGSRASMLLNDLGIEEPGAPWAHSIIDLDGVELRVVRHDQIGTIGYDLIHGKTHFETIWQRLAAAGAIPVGTRALETMRIKGGVPTFPTEFGSHSVPLEAEGMNGISEGKGCYPGQEVIERTLALGRPARQLVTVQSSQPVDAGPLHNEDEKTVGELTSVAELPDGQCIGLALIRHRARNDESWLRDGVSVQSRSQGTE